MAKKSHKHNELNTDSTDEKLVSKIDNEQINDISSTDDAKVETIVNESGDSSNKNFETESVDVIENTKETKVEVKKSADIQIVSVAKKIFNFMRKLYTSKELEDLTKT